MSTSGSIPMQIKGRRDGFILVPDAESSFDSILAYMDQRILESQDFFKQSEMTLDLRARPLRTDEILALHHLLVEKAKVKLVEVKMSEDFSLMLEPSPSRPALPSKSSTPDAPVNSPIIIRSTCRSGIRIESSSDCVILGDVNPGAEVIAVGDVIVFGNLRGIAHAGASGDRSARIWALSIEPSQIRIADMVAVPPRGNKPTPKRFEIAEIQESSIEVITL